MPKHIFITEIKYVETDRSPWEIVSTHGPFDQITMFDQDRAQQEVTVTVVKELMHAAQFRREDGSTFYVGCSKQAAEVLFMQKEAWEILQREHADALDKLNFQRNINDRLRAHILRHRNASLWQRIKAVFIGN